MKIIRSLKEMANTAAAQKSGAKSIGFVPTMGALHQGHLSLIRRARKENDFVVVSIFVNPTQFAPGEDFEKYPRHLKLDAQLCRKEGVDIVFSPGAKQMYPDNYKTYVQVEDLSNHLCGLSRPGHFKAVATVVAKLFNLVRPDIAYFGQKDAQQAIIIKRMAADLNMPVKIKVLATVRQRNGLALSSRNVYLTKQEKQEALVLFKSLNLARALLKKGRRNVKFLLEKIKALIRLEKRAVIDYVAIVDRRTLQPVKKISDNCLLALAVRIGKTRLLDNTILKGKR